MSVTTSTAIEPLEADGRRAGAIGPNAIIRVAEVLGAVEGPQQLQRIFCASDLERYLDDPPGEMVDEREVARLHREVRRLLGDDRARTIGWMAGVRTADYLLRHRIPRAAQVAMRCLPGRQAGWLLATAISRNAWTFAGTGSFTVRHGHPAIFSIANCPLCRGRTAPEPYCDFYAGTFERLFRVLVHPDARAVEIACQARGRDACRFSITWRAVRRA